MNILGVIAAKLDEVLFILLLLLLLIPVPYLMATQDILLIDDRSSGDMHANTGNAWYLITDSVMGGVSSGQVVTDTIENRPCLRMRGDVSLENNGGFVQLALNLSNDVLQNVADYSGILLEVYGNNEQYNVHLRTQDILLPWQSYRASFTAIPEWKMIRLPFAEFEAYRIAKSLDLGRLKRIGIVAIGRKFYADLCIGKLGLYR